MGWIIVMFDLPVGTRIQRKRATGFRNWLLEDGYEMLQFSVYVRACVDRDRVRKHSRRIQAECPKNGNVRILFLTDKQWEQGIAIMGGSFDQGNRSESPKMPQQTEFW
jgi:CRISPR-associated protein Cas2